MTRITIDDDMVERAARAVFGQSSLEQGSFWGIANPRAAFRTALEAALDRRTGPKDRRVEQDDTCGWSRRMSNFGRRDDDKCWVDLPRKSDRLKREAEEVKEKASVHEMICELEILLQNIGVDRDTPTAVIAKAVATIYRAMRLQEMKERGQ